MRNNLCVAGICTCVLFLGGGSRAFAENKEDGWTIVKTPAKSNTIDVDAARMDKLRQVLSHPAVSPTTAKVVKAVPSPSVGPLASKSPVSGGGRSNLTVAKIDVGSLKDKSSASTSSQPGVFVGLESIRPMLAVITPFGGSGGTESSLSGGIGSGQNSAGSGMLKTFDRVGTGNLTVTNSRVLAAVSGKPPEDSGDGNGAGDFLDTVMQKGGVKDQVSDKPSALSSPSPVVSADKEGGEVLVSGSGVGDDNGVAEKDDNSEHGTAKLPAAIASPSPSASPNPVGESDAEDKVFTLVGGQLPDHTSVRRAAEPKVGFYPKAPEPDTAQSIFMRAEGGDLPAEKAPTW